MQRIDEREEECQKLLKVINYCQSEYKLLKSNYENITYKPITEDENKMYFYTGIPTMAIFDLILDFI